MSAPTQDEFDKWKAELAELEAQISSLSDRRDLIRKVLNMVPAIEKLRGNRPI